MLASAEVARQGSVSRSPRWSRSRQTRQPNLEGAGEIPLRRLVQDALRMRPSRSVVGEVHQEECLGLATVDHRAGGRGDIDLVRHGGEDLTSLRRAAVADADVQFSADPALEAKVRDVVGLVPASTGEGGDALRRREAAHPGAGVDCPDPAGAARAPGGGQLRLHPARHHHAVRRPGGGHRPGARDLHPAPPPPPPEVQRLLQAGRRRLPAPRVCTWWSTTTPPTNTHRPGLAQASSAGAPALPPTSGSWLNLVEAFFSTLTHQALRRGGFPTVADLIVAVQRFIDARNDRCAPFTWRPRHHHRQGHQPTPSQDTAGASYGRGADRHQIREPRRFRTIFGPGNMMNRAREQLGGLIDSKRIRSSGPWRVIGDSIVLWSATTRV